MPNILILLAATYSIFIVFLLIVRSMLSIWLGTGALWPVLMTTLTVVAPLAALLFFALVNRLNIGRLIMVQVCWSVVQFGLVLHKTPFFSSSQNLPSFRTFQYVVLVAVPLILTIGMHFAGVRRQFEPERYKFDRVLSWLLKVIIISQTVWFGGFILL